MFDHGELAAAADGVWLGLEARKPRPITRIITDSRGDCGGGLFLALKGERFDGHEHAAAAVAAGAVAVCVEHSRRDMAANWPETPTLVVADTLTAYQAIARFHRRRLADKLLLVGITGSSGKTSTKEMVRTLLAQHFGEANVLATTGNTNNQVGVPQNLLRLDASHRAAVIEMGTNHPGEIASLTATAEPDIAAICSIGPCHLEFLGDLRGVAREKSAIFSGLPLDRGIAIYPENCPESTIVAAAAMAFKNMPVADAATAKDAALTYRYLGGNLNGSRFELAWTSSGQRATVEWRLVGAHQAANAAIAAAVATALGMAPAAIAAALADVTLPGMRCKIEQIDGATWINDAYNANPDSMAAGLRWLAEFANQEKLLLVLGDMLEMGEAAATGHAATLELARNLLPDARLALVGPNMRTAAETIGISKSASLFADSAAAANAIAPLIPENGTVFLKGSRGTALEKIIPIPKNPKL